MNGLGYPTSYQYGDGFTSLPYFPTPTPASPAAPTNRVATNLQINSQQASRGLRSFAPPPTLTLSIASHSPLGWSAPSRQTSRPCRCGRGRFFYPTRMMIAVHELLPFPIQFQGSHTTPRKLSVSQTATFMVSQNGLEVSFLKTFFIPLYRYCEDNTERMRVFLEREPWLDVNRIESDKVVCLGCGCDVFLGSIEYDPGNWMHHRDWCVGIENAILSSVLDAWEVKSVKSLAVNS
ncbi:uncharacterized protein ARMOST_12116 [Armillaria ostoyae]|uniref:Uncharacterized protein n=1 Tax=Armillaria ostoyae TaxID=47428 RepID=A0A284RJ08_ARMOS|nr:uncharacterized protein ARMOST_12116 [Armillaria ostoyae]